jgi:carboxypeptidase PM20D1
MTGPTAQRRVSRLCAAGILCLAALPGFAATPAVEDATLARSILAHAVSVQTVAGRGQVPALADWLSHTLEQGGFAGEDLEVLRHGETAALLARYRGSDATLAPLVLSVHLDVVEARREDWQRDPFMLSESDGYLFGRGVYDNKFETSMLVTTLLRLKREGFVPLRDIVLAASGDEETSMETTRLLASRLRGAWMVINGDGDANPIDDSGKPLGAKLQAAEKTYATFELRATNAGGHSSRPRLDNAIYDLANALQRLQQHQFPLQLNPITRAYLRGIAPQASAQQRDAMLRLAEDPQDSAAAAVLDQDPEYLGILRTTCVATMLSAGHAENALAQLASATVNCRIMPGTGVDEVADTLRAVIADPGIEVLPPADVTESPFSPLREEVLAALARAIGLRHPGLDILPYMSAGGTDNMHFRAAGIDSYCVSSLFMRPQDDYAHGLDERVPADAIAPALEFWHVLLRELATQRG